MMKRFSTLLLVLFLCAMAYAIVQLFLLRFENGDVYPPMSSLRSDPLGTMVLFESLQRLANIEVRRDMQASNRMPPGENTTYLHLGALIGPWREMPRDSVFAIERFLAQGGRLVVVLSPVGPEFQTKEPPAKDKKKRAYEKKKEEEDKRAEPDAMDIAKRWKYQIGIREIGDMPNSQKAVRIGGTAPIPDELTWHSAAYFKDLDPSWHVIYSESGHPVVVERSIGDGSLVLISDSYLLTNEAMLRDRHPDLLSWIVGPGRRIFFDEGHFGITATPGIAALARKYRLHGGVAVLILIALLFIWKNSSSLVPRRESAADAEVLGRDSSSAFVSLLRRNIRPDLILGTCVAEWKKSLAAGLTRTSRSSDVDSLAEEETDKPAREKDPVKTYLAICRALTPDILRRAPVEKPPST
jgi:hypothetical protein